MTHTPSPETPVSGEERQSSDMVERVARAMHPRTWKHFMRHAERALEASHHAELVEALKTARKQVVAAILSPQMSVEAAEVAVAPIDATLRKIGGDQ